MGKIVSDGRFLYKNVSKINVILLILVVIFPFSLLCGSTYALFSSEFNGANGISITVKSKVEVVGDLLKDEILKGYTGNVEVGLCASNDTTTGNDTYYYKGNVSNNYVSFANKIWRIVRITDVGNIKLIL